MIEMSSLGSVDLVCLIWGQDGGFCFTLTYRLLLIWVLFYFTYLSVLWLTDEQDFLFYSMYCLWVILRRLNCKLGKEVNKEQPSYRNLAATATRVLQYTCPVAASRKYLSAINTSPHLTSTHLTPDYVNTIILHLVSVLYTAFNVWNTNLCLLCLMNCFHYLA